MKILKRKILSALAFVIALNAMSQNVYADNDEGDRRFGIECVGNYSNWDDLDNINSPIDIANGFYSEFSSNDKKWSVAFKLLNNYVNETDFKGQSLGGNDNIYADNVDLLIYSGHGVMPGKHGASDYSFALNTKHDSKYAKQKEMFLGNRDLEWLITFTCNFLASKDLDKIGHMAKGIHAICGYETTVILTKDMGKVFAKKLKKGFSVKESFFAMAKDTKTWHGGGTAGVFTTTTNKDDRIWGYGTTQKDPESYTRDSSDYILYTYKY